VARRAISSEDNRRVSRQLWDIDADDYQAEHGAFLGDVDFVWCEIFVHVLTSRRHSGGG
jgi:hypothetical protein